MESPCKIRVWWVAWDVLVIWSGGRWTRWKLKWENLTATSSQPKNVREKNKMWTPFQKKTKEGNLCSKGNILVWKDFLEATCKWVRTSLGQNCKPLRKWRSRARALFNALSAGEVNPRRVQDTLKRLNWEDIIFEMRLRVQSWIPFWIQLWRRPHTPKLIQLEKGTY